MKRLLFILFAVGFSFHSSAQECHESGPEVHGMAPIGVMNGHMHSKGHFMASYRFMQMGMGGVSSQGNEVSSDQLLMKYMMAPVQMHMQMHMLGVMYAPIERVTVGVMTSYQRRDMSMLVRRTHSEGMGGTVGMTMEPTEYLMTNGGFGDTRLVGLIRLTKSAAHCLHAIVGVQMPTGSIDAMDQMHPVLPYAMQLGSGSIEAVTGLNYSYIGPHILFGGQLNASLPINENSNGYLVGTFHDANLWVSRKLVHWLSSSARLNWRIESGVRGVEPRLNPMMSPTSMGGNQANHGADALIGLNAKPFERWRVGLEGGVPIYQWNKGEAMNRSWLVQAGVQCMLSH